MWLAATNGFSLGSGLGTHCNRKRRLNAAVLRARLLLAGRCLWQVALRPLHSQCGAKHNRHYFPHVGLWEVRPTHARATRVSCAGEGV